MKIIIKTKNVEIRYETSNDSQYHNPACCSDKWSGKSNNEVLLRTISHMATEAQTLDVLSRH